MKRILMVALLGLALAGCDSPPQPDGTPTESRSAYTLRTYDAQYKVVCYRSGQSTNNLSCVKVE